MIKKGVKKMTNNKKIEKYDERGNLIYKKDSNSAEIIRKSLEYRASIKNKENSIKNSNK